MTLSLVKVVLEILRPPLKWKVCDLGYTSPYWLKFYMAVISSPVSSLKNISSPVISHLTTIWILFYLFIYLSIVRKILPHAYSDPRSIEPWACTHWTEWLFRLFFKKKIRLVVLHMTGEFKWWCIYNATALHFQHIQHSYAAFQPWPFTLQDCSIQFTYVMCVFFPLERNHSVYFLCSKF